MEVKINESWKKYLKEEFNKPYFEKLANFVKKEYKEKKICPPAPLIFNAFNLCPFNSVKVVIIGQDPYHGKNQANGLCFSVNKGINIPPSLQNIYKEIKSDLGKSIPLNGNLERWANQGVFLLNATLTVEEGLSDKAGSHQDIGWEKFTDKVIEILNKEKKNIIFLLWGAYAKRKGQIIDRKRHLVLEAAHPSPFSADKGFFGCRHFSHTNEYLKIKKIKPIDW